MLWILRLDTNTQKLAKEALKKIVLSLKNFRWVF
jgi:hypothetical protein